MYIHVTMLCLLQCYKIISVYKIWNYFFVWVPINYWLAKSGGVVGIIGL